MINTPPIRPGVIQLSGDAALSVHTLDEAAEILRVRKSWLERQAAARKIPFAMLGGSYRFTADHLVAIVRMHESAPLAEVAPFSAPAAHRPARDMRTVSELITTPLRARPRPGPRRAA